MSDPEKSSGGGISIMGFIPIAIFAVLLAAFFVPGLLRDNPNDIPSVREGSPAPELFLSDVQDSATAFNNDTLRQPGMKLVNFWASWCPPCRAEHPNLIKLAEDGLPIYGINYRDQPDKAAAFIAELGDPFTASLLDPKGRNGIEWGVLAMPESYLIDSDGKIVLHFRGPITQRTIEDTIMPAIKAAQ